MNAAELTFGIEIETTIGTAQAALNGLRVGSYYHGIQVPYLPEGWVAKHDGSIRTNNPNRTGCEIVSPVLRGAAGLEEAIKVVKILEEKGHQVNDSCGVHVHVGWNRSWPSEALARLITQVAYLERGLYAITGTKNRERGMYCGGVRKYGNDKAAKENLDCNRYHVLNLANLASGNKDTVEFRAFSGSLNPVKIAGWIQICLGLVERALVVNRKAKWNPPAPKGGWKKDGEGQTEAERLMSVLAWGNACYFRQFGRALGWVSDAVPMNEVKKEFRRLAKKYDEMI